MINASGNIVKSLVIPKLVKGILSFRLSTFTKSQNIYVFAFSLILNPPNIRTSLKQLTAENLFIFSNLFFIRKLTKTNPIDNKLLFRY